MIEENLDNIDLRKELRKELDENLNVIVNNIRHGGCFYNKERFSELLNQIFDLKNVSIKYYDVNNSKEEK